MREANLIVAQVLDHLGSLIEPGITTSELDAVAERMTLKAGAKPAFKGYRGYPATVCASVNDRIVHGIPNDDPLKQGDIIGLDVGVCYKGFFGDAAWSFSVGTI